MKIKTIKDVDEETWRILKDLSSKRKLKMGSVLKYAVREYAKKAGKRAGIIPSKPILTDKEAEEMLRLVQRMRKESGYRNVINA